MKVVYWKCDRCGERLEDISKLAMIIFIGKQKEICKECQEDFKLWLKTVRKIKTKRNPTTSRRINRK